MALAHIFPVVEMLGRADEHHVFLPSSATVPLECGTLIHLTGLAAIVAQTIYPGTHGSIYIPTNGIKLRCPFDVAGGELLAGEVCYLNRATGVVRQTGSPVAAEVAVKALPRLDRDWTAANAAAGTGDATVVVLLQEGTTVGSTAHVPFTGTAGLGN